MNLSENIENTQEQKHLYTQNDVDRIVEKRISRERKNLESYRELKDFINQLKDGGKISADSINGQISEIKGLIENDKAADANEEAEAILEDAIEESVENLSAEDEENTSQMLEDTAKIYNTEISAENIQKICSHKLFYRFAKGKNSDIETLCRDFTEFLDVIENDKGRKKLAANAAKATPVLQISASESCPLSSAQKELAKKAGMSYKKYYELISEIPAGKNRK